jgi:hypothetical protein
VGDEAKRPHAERIRDRVALKPTAIARRDAASVMLGGMRWLVAAMVVASGCGGRPLSGPAPGAADQDPRTPSAEIPDAAAPPASAPQPAGVVDAGPTAGATPPLFRPTLPLSTALATSRTPTFAWTDLDGADYYLVDLCLDRQCQRVQRTLASGLTSVSADEALDPGVTFWRVRGHLMNGGYLSTAVWELFVGRKSAPQDCAQPGRPDFDGDGLADLALGSVGGSVQVTSFVKGGLPRDAPSTVAPAAVALGYAGDLDGDGYGDLAVGRPGAVDVYHGGGAGLSLVASVSGNGDFGATVAGLGDVDGDGYGDLLVSEPSGRRFFVYRGGASGLGPAGAPLTADQAAPAGDVNGDGYADGVICGAQTRAQLLVGSPAGLRPGPVLEAPGGGVTIGAACGGVGDVDGDGFGDLAVSGLDGAGHPVAVLYHGGPSALQRQLQPLPAGGAAAAAGDLDGDGLGDLLLMDSPAGPVVFPGGAGAGVPVAANAGVAAGVGDVDGDGYDDVVVAPASCTSPVQIFAGQQGGLTMAPFYQFPVTAPCPLLAR